RSSSRPPTSSTRPRRSSPTTGGRWSPATDRSARVAMATSSITVASGEVETVVGGRAARAAPRRRRSWAWVGLLPFFAFLGMFLLYPTVTVFGQALSGGHLGAMREAITGQYQRSFVASLKLSLVTAVLGGILGVMLAYALATLEHPKFLRSGA